MYDCTIHCASTKNYMLKTAEVFFLEIVMFITTKCHFN